MIILLVSIIVAYVGLAYLHVHREQNVSLKPTLSIKEVSKGTVNISCDVPLGTYIHNSSKDPWRQLPADLAYTKGTESKVVTSTGTNIVIQPVPTQITLETKTNNVLVEYLRRGVSDGV